jgi:lipopolysaccharide export LptBFGC system permease protein LptF
MVWVSNLKIMRRTKPQKPNSSLYDERVTRFLMALKHAPIIERAREKGIDIPEKYWEIQPTKFHVPTLSPEGIKYLQREMKRMRRSAVEFWAKIVLPVVALVISIVSLLIKH